jgi:hypothetical protein
MTNVELFLLFIEHHTPEFTGSYEAGGVDYCLRLPCHACSIQKTCDKYSPSVSPTLSSEDMELLAIQAPEWVL